MAYRYVERSLEHMGAVASLRWTANNAYGDSDVLNLPGDEDILARIQDGKRSPRT